MRQERERWTESVTLKSSAGDIKAKLRDLPICPDTLFPGGYELIKSACDDFKEAAEMVAAVCEKDVFTPPTAPAPVAKKTRRSHSTSSSSATEQSPTPAPAKPKDTAGSGDGGARRDHNRPEEPKSRYVKGRGQQARK